MYIYYYVLYVVGYVLQHPYLDISWMEKCVIHLANSYVYGELVSDVFFEVNLILNEIKRYFGNIWWQPLQSQVQTL